MENGPGNHPYMPVTTALDVRGRPALKNKTGSWRAVPFLLVLEVCEVSGFAILAINLVTYLLQEGHFSYSDAAVMTTNFLGTSFTVPIVAGFVADAYMGRFPAVVLFGLVEVTGLSLITLSASVPSLRKTPPCLSPPACPALQGSPYSILMAGLYLTAIGSGGVRVNLSSHGADQFDQSDPKERLQMSSFFNWFFFCLAMGFGIAATFLVYVQQVVSFGLGFGLAVGMVFVGLSCAVMGTPYYRFEVPVGSPLTRIAQVLVAAIRKRKIQVPSNETDLFELHQKDDDEAENRPKLVPLAHTNQFRFLDKAATIEHSDSTADKYSPWKLCTVTQVEEVKALARLVPIWATTIMLNVCLAQLQTFSIEQGVTTNRYIGKNGSFQIPAASIVAFPVLLLLVLSPLYELAFVPAVRRLTHRATGITNLQRIGIGLGAAVVSMTIAGAVERHRRRVAEESGQVDNPLVLLGEAAIPVSVFWLVPQYLVFGVADLFTYVGVLEFFYSEAPDGMRSLGTGISQTTLALGYFLSSTIVNIVKSATGGGGEWLPANLNRGHLDYFYWLLAVINVVNLALFLVCARGYKYRSRNGISAAAEKMTTSPADVSTTEVLLTGVVAPSKTVGQS